MKLITFTVPCYNSAAYMDHCIETLLSAGEQAEIILVDDAPRMTPANCRTPTPKSTPPSSASFIRRTAPRRGCQPGHPQRHRHVL